MLKFLDIRQGNHILQVEGMKMRIIASIVVAVVVGSVVAANLSRMFTDVVSVLGGSLGF